MQKFAPWRLSAPSFIETRASFASESGFGNTGLKIWTTLNRGKWLSQCYIERTGGNPYAQCGGGYLEGTGQFSTERATKVGIWHTLCIEIYPTDATFRFYIDREQVKIVTFEDKSTLDNIEFAPIIDAYSATDSSVRGDFDYVRISPINETTSCKVSRP
jgi:hypothetical protein